MDNVVHNSEKINIPKESLGKYFFNILKNGNTNDIINVDAITGKILTRGQLLERSVKLTYIFNDHGIKFGDKVAFISENSVNYVTVILAGLYTGVIICPLNPSYSIDELKHGLLYAKPKLIICSESTFKRVDKLKNEFDFIQEIFLIEEKVDKTLNAVSLDELYPIITANVACFRPISIDTVEDGALIFLSSGTTGLPKGVLVNQECIRLCATGFGHPNYGNGAACKVAILVLPFFHIFGLTVHLLTISSNTKGVIMSKFDPYVFLKSIQDYRVDLLYLAPPLVVFFAKSPIVFKYDLSSVKEVMVGGAPLSKDSATEAQKRLGSVAIRQVYGVTELGGVVTTEPNSASKNLGTIGVLVPGFSGKVAQIHGDANLGPLELGELCFKSLGAMKGYIQEDRLNRNDFDEDGFYHTGDLGYYDEDNYFYIVDRIKEIIKYKGFQVAPAELEALILTHPAVRDCAVTAVPDEKAGELPLGLVVKKDGVNVTKQEIVDFVAERISVQKHLYGGVQFVKEIPKNPSGKILRKILKEMIEKN